MTSNHWTIPDALYILVVLSVQILSSIVCTVPYSVIAYVCTQNPLDCNVLLVTTTTSSSLRMTGFTCIPQNYKISYELQRTSPVTTKLNGLCYLRIFLDSCGRGQSQRVGCHSAQELRIHQTLQNCSRISK